MAIRSRGEDHPKGHKGTKRPEPRRKKKREQRGRETPKERETGKLGGVGGEKRGISVLEKGGYKTISFSVIIIGNRWEGKKSTSCPKN